MQPPKPLHESARRYLACVANPFSGPLARGISGNHPAHQTVVLRRRNVVSFSVGTGTFATGTASVAGGGVDLYIPLCSTFDPYVIAGSSSNSSWASNTWRSSFGKPSSALLPAGSLFRTVSAGVRITPTNASDRVSGAFSLFAPSAYAATDTSSELLSLGPGLGFGAPRLDLNEAVAIVPLMGSKTITFVAPISDLWNAVDDTEAAVIDSTVAGANSFKPSAHMRLWYQASTSDPQNFIIEISQVVEYYHDSHSAFAEKALSHPDGVQITQAVAAVLSEPGTNVASANGSSLYDKLKKATGVVEAGGELLAKTMRTAYGAKKGYDLLKALYTGAETVGELALLAA